ncbi:synembryn-A isoform X1 [Erinaceus europaeus]|uniref:Synembryn n=1 Tax=Erinaceus europaeus TaxID=9365 RepID=A0ABM3W5H1_ERIEU|nr:synembryn-A isoform X1 [Erinaceus europaeus]
MELRAVADAVEAGEEDVALEVLHTYNRENCESFTFEDAQQEDRKRLATLLAARLEQGLAPGRRTVWLQSVRILSRDRGCLDALCRPGCLRALAGYAGLAAPEAEGKTDADAEADAEADALLEALKGLCNLVLSSPGAQALAAEEGLAARLAARVARAGRGLPHDVRFFDLRLLFLLTALRRDARLQLRDLRGVALLTAALERTVGPGLGRLPPREAERAMEILKVLFNITFEPLQREMDEEDAALFRRLGTVLRHCVMVTAAGDRTEEFHGHAVNLLGNLPPACLDVLLALEPRPGSLEFLGVNMDVIGTLLIFLENRLLQTHRLKERVAPVLSVLTECARLHRPARKFLKAQAPPRSETPCPGTTPFRDPVSRCLPTQRPRVQAWPRSETPCPGDTPFRDPVSRRRPTQRPRVQAPPHSETPCPGDTPFRDPVSRRHPIQRRGIQARPCSETLCPGAAPFRDPMSRQHPIQRPHVQVLPGSETPCPGDTPETTSPGDTPFRDAVSRHHPIQRPHVQAPPHSETWCPGAAHSETPCPGASSLRDLVSRRLPTQRPGV